MLGHIGVNVHDLVQAKAYYDALMPLLGFEPYIAATDQFAYRPINSKRLIANVVLSSLIEPQFYCRNLGLRPIRDTQRGRHSCFYPPAGLLGFKVRVCGG